MTKPRPPARPNSNRRPNRVGTSHAQRPQHEYADDDFSERMYASAIQISSSRVTPGRAAAMTNRRAMPAELTSVFWHAQPGKEENR